MKNKFLLKVCILIVVLFSQNNIAKGQWVTIPDPNFVLFLQENYPTCMNGDQMDTTCNAITLATHINCASKSIENLYGIQYFSSLQHLDCTSNQLTTIPELPESLYILQCNSNNITYLPTLPNTLNWIECFYNQLTNLPNLPNSLIFLNCNHNLLTSLPELPTSLASIQCRSNQLSSLPELPNILQAINCSENHLTSLPELPDSLLGILCSNNNLTSLPKLPTFLNVLDCSYNNISCFPLFPPMDFYNNYFLLHPNPFTCLPNNLQNNQINYSSYPICEIGDYLNNPNNCESAQVIKGNLFKDVNGNCINDSTDTPIENISIYLYDELNNLIATTYTASSGGYSFYQFSGTYTVAIDTLNQPYISNCAEIGLDSTFVLNQNSLIDSINFAITCKPGIDLGIQSIYQLGLVFPSQPHQLNISAGDMLNWYNLNCASGTSGTVQINVTGSVAYTGTPDNVLIPDATDGNNFTYNIADFGAVPLNSFGLSFLTDTTAQAGEEICVTATVTPNGLDNDTTNNLLTYCYPVVNSYDPNAKDVYPTSVLPNYDGYFTYTIHFQNTGNAPAINIKVQDTLSTNLDLSTFEITAYSHPNNTTLSGSLLSFKFPNIWLPDSTSDLEGSKGFVQYRIKPIANLPVGTQITNTAYIYFDFNAPIQTNTTESNFEIIQSLKTYSKGKISVYPNPNNGIFHINMLEKNTNEKTMELTNIVGEKVWSQKTRSNTATIDINHLPKGLYILNVTDNNSHYMERVVRN